MNRRTADLLRCAMPHVAVGRPLTPYQSLLCSDKAGQLLGYRPRHSWRDHARP